MNEEDLKNDLNSDKVVIIDHKIDDLKSHCEGFSRDHSFILKDHVK